MASKLKFDELNKIITEYYEPMDISKEQNLERIELAELLFDVFLFMFTYLDAQISASVSMEIDKENLYDMMTRRYEDAVEEYGINLDKHPELSNYIPMVIKDMTDSTFDGLNTKIQDRALSVAMNESNTILNRVEFDNAVSSGKYTHKTWITERDNRVRNTHRDVDYKTIPIADLFDVGMSKMAYPKDMSNGADASEIVNCRCSVKYS